MADVSPRSTWLDRRVLVTGHSGFKGSWLTLWLDHIGAKVVGFSDEVPTTPSLFAEAGIDHVASSMWGDVRDLEVMCSVMEESRASVVLHLAAQALVRPSYDDPAGTFETNTMGTVNVLEAVRRVGPQVEAVVVVTTDKCYENRGWEYGYREHDRLGGRDAYSASKAAAELAVSSYRAQLVAEGHRAAVATVRAGNVIGGGDWATDRLIPDLVRAAAEPEARVELRHPGAERPWQHVLDCLAGYLVLTERLLGDTALAGPWNFGPEAGRSATVGEVAERFLASLGREVGIDVRPDPGRHEEPVLALDASRARRRLGWRPRLELAQAIDMTAGWYVAHREGGDARQLTLEQIRAFENIG